MYQLKLEKFEGPLNLLLNLIELEQLDLSQVSLAQVADQYVKYLEENPQISPEELADFLVVATKLLLLKSKLLVPDLAIDEEDDPAGLEKQLRIYRQYLNAVQVIEAIIKKRNFLFWREKPPMAFKPQFSPGKDLTVEKLKSAFLEILKEVEKFVVLPESIMEKTITLQDKIRQIKELIKSRVQVNFDQLMKVARSKTEVLVSFLALLELVKQQEVHVHQDKLFGDISIKKM